MGAVQKEGRDLTQVAMAKRMLNQLTDEEIAGFTLLSLNVVQQLRKQATED